MAPNPTERPAPLQRPQHKPSPVTARPVPASRQPSSSNRTAPDGGGNSARGGNSGGHGGGGNNGSTPPSPWLDPNNEPQPDKSASFVEYLRWMRSPDSEYKDPTKVQLLQMAEEQANYPSGSQSPTEGNPP